MRLKSMPALVVASLAFLSLYAPAARAGEPLHVLASNPRYFADSGGHAVFLAGSHTWDNLQEIARGKDWPNPVVDFGAYLEFLKQRNLNCFRLWTWESAASFDSTGAILYRLSPMPWLRSGPGLARDSLPRFDLTRYNPDYFSRLRQRVEAAREKQMYVIVMLFQGFSLNVKDRNHGNPWPGDPFNAANNVNGVDGDPEHSDGGLATHSLDLPRVTALQEAWLRKVIDTVNDMDNVLYEITNEDEGGEKNTAWQYHIINYIKEYESTRPYRHPVGMTAQWPEGSNAVLFDSPADWVSPTGEGGYQTDPPAADGRKVILNDTDHSFFYTGLKKAGPEGQRAWVWKNFTRGNQLLFMDPFIDPTPWYMQDRNHPQGGGIDPYWDTLRLNMGYARRFAERLDLAAMTPQCVRASSGFCLAAGGSAAAFLAYLPSGPWVTLDLTGVEGDFRVEWFNPAEDKSVDGGVVAGGARRELKAPFGGDAVLYVHR